MIRVSKILTYPHDEPPFVQSKKVLVGGCFDLLHYGHLSFLKAAKRQGECLIIGLESDATITQLKGSPPIHSHIQRAEILAELECVDYVLLLPYLGDYDDYLTLVKRVNPDSLAITKGDRQTANKKKQAQAIKACVIEVNQLIEGLSSSLIRSSHL